MGEYSVLWNQMQGAHNPNLEEGSGDGPDNVPRRSALLQKDKHELPRYVWRMSMVKDTLCSNCKEYNAFNKLLNGRQKSANYKKKESRAWGKHISNNFKQHNIWWTFGTSSSTKIFKISHHKKWRRFFQTNIPGNHTY